MENLKVGQVWKGRTRTKTIVDVHPSERIDYIDSKDGQEWYQQWATFKAWVEITGAKLEGRDESTRAD